MSTYRVGRRVGRTIYRDDELVGLMDTPELAAAVVAALESQAQRDEAIRGHAEAIRLMTDDGDDLLVMRTADAILALLAPAKDAQ